jgi:hypothetical protein
MDSLWRTQRCSRVDKAGNPSQLEGRAPDGQDSDVVSDTGRADGVVALGLYGLF